MQSLTLLSSAQGYEKQFLKFNYHVQWYEHDEIPKRWLCMMAMRVHSCLLTRHTRHARAQPVTCTCTVFCFSLFPLSVVADISHRPVNIFIQFQIYILFLSNNHLHITLFTSLYTFPLPSKKTTFWHTSHYSKKATTLNKNFKVSTSIKYSSVSTQKTWADSNR